MQDLSAQAADSMWVTSQDGGNMTSRRPGAMSAPGTLPGNPALAQREQPAPEIAFSNATAIEPGDNGRPDPGHGVPGGDHGWVKTPAA